MCNQPGLVSESTGDSILEDSGERVHADPAVTEQEREKRLKCVKSSYQIPISLSCGGPSRWPIQRCSLEECRAEVSIWRKPC
ncbi:hypothetical protein SRHO_G00148860 [Serrasalmus rhombeus]